MAPPYLTSPRKPHQLTVEEFIRSPQKARRRQGPIPKSTAEKSRSLHHLTSTCRMMTQDLSQQINIVHEFTVNWNNQAQRLQAVEKSSDEDTPCQRHSYTREQKLNAVTYYFNTKVTDKQGEVKQISKYKAAKNLGLDDSLLSRWIKQEDLIRATKKGIRKDQAGKKAQEEEMEQQLYEAFAEKRRENRRINRKWFIWTAHRFYEKIYSHRVSQTELGKKVYTGFNFSDGWFNGFKKRHSIALRSSTKKAQQPPADFEKKIITWLKYNRRQLMNWEGNHSQETQHIGRVKLAEIANMNQV